MALAFIQSILIDLNLHLFTSFDNMCIDCNCDESSQLFVPVLSASQLHGGLWLEVAGCVALSLEAAAADSPRRQCEW